MDSPLEITMSDKPSGFADLAEQLRRELPTFSRSKATLARRILEDPQVVAFMTISDLAVAAGVNESTVHRFAVGLGLDGYPALAQLCRAKLREQALMVKRFEQLNDSASTGIDLPSQLAATARQDQNNIVRTFSQISEQTWTTAISALSTKRSIYVMGLRQTYSAAHLLAYLLKLVRDQAFCVSLGDGTLVDQIRTIGKDDCFVPISIHRYMRDTVIATRVAYERGATTIVLTDNEASPLLRYATVVVYVSIDGESILRSTTAFTSLVQAFAAGVASERGMATRSALLIGEELLHQFGIYHSPPSP